jgi:hypothetical protein
MSKKKTIDARITSITKETLVEDGSQFLDVAFEILDGETVLSVRKLGFPLDTDQTVIAEEVKSTAQGYKADIALAESRQEQDAKEAQADETIDQLINKEL